MNTKTQKIETALLWVFLVLATLILIAATTLEFHVNPAVKIPIILGVVAMDTLVIVNWIIQRFWRKADKA
ncbi:MAG: hypothetical protein IAE94_05185 [Chthoniobacterales bacterium]|nr:hypothetical protein [Chthoniobacterales bacterium]